MAESALMDVGNCSLSVGNLSIGNWSKTCALPGAATTQTTLEVKVSYARWLVASAYELSCSEVRVPRTPLTVYVGCWAGIFELVMVMAVGSALLAACGFLGHRLWHSARVAPAVKAVIIGAMWLGIPLLPFAVLAVCGRMQGLMTNFAMALMGVIGFFRLLELGAGSGPKGFDHTARGFSLYMGSPVEVLFGEDGRALAAPKGSCWWLFLSVLGHAASFIVLLAVGDATKFTPFLGHGADILAMPAMGLPASLPALWLQAAFVYLQLTVMMDFLCLVCAVFGVEAHRPMCHPLLLSTSVRDFWGRRWNLLIHRLMHRNFFMPVVGRLGPRAGAIAAFFASAIFHEYMWVLANYEAEGYLPGGPIAFFVVQFILLTAEALLKRTKLGCAARALPAPVQTVLTTLAILPFGPLFLSGLHRGGLMYDAVRLFPHPRLVSQ